MTGPRVVCNCTACPRCGKVDLTLKVPDDEQAIDVAAHECRCGYFWGHMLPLPPPEYPVWYDTTTREEMSALDAWD